MGRFKWTVAAAIALACAACSKETPKAPPAPAESAASAPITETRAPPPAAPDATLAATPPTPEPMPAAAPPPALPPQHVMTIVPAKERRIHALLNNAIARDVTGETEHDAGMWEARRAACRTQTCVDRAYAAQETALRRWEGSEAIR